MNCRTAELAFSGHYDGSLSAADRRSLERHLADCKKCASDFADYVRAVARLKDLRPGRASGVYVESIVARVERTAPDFEATPSGRRAALRRVASHFAAASVGAAAAFLLLSFGPQSSRDPSPTPTPIAAQPVKPNFPRPEIHALPVRFVGDDRSIERNDRVEEDAGSLTLTPGERLRALPSQRLELSMGESGELIVRAERIELQAPVVQKTVNEITFVDLPPLVTVDERLVQTAVDKFESEVQRRLTTLQVESSMNSFLNAISEIDRRAQAAGERDEASGAHRDETSPSVPRPATVEPNPVEPSPVATPPALTPEHHSEIEVAERSPVVIRRDANRTSLSIDGSLTVVLPELIALLDESDADVADLAATRLDDIRAELERDPELRAQLKAFPNEIEDAPTEPRGVLGNLIRLPAFIQDNSPRAVPLAERWRRWWRDNAITIVTAGSRDS